MNSAKLFNWLLQALALLIALAAILTYGKVSWEFTKVLMGGCLLAAFSAFFHAIYHYNKEKKMFR